MSFNSGVLINNLHNHGPWYLYYRNSSFTTCSVISWTEIIQYMVTNTSNFITVFSLVSWWGKNFRVWTQPPKGRIHNFDHSCWRRKEHRRTSRCNLCFTLSYIWWIILNEWIKFVIEIVTLVKFRTMEHSSTC